MQDRRERVREKVLFGGVAEFNEHGSTMDCVVRNFSETGACIELAAPARIPEKMQLTIPRKGRSFLAQMIWRQANRVGLAFRAMVTDAPDNDLDARLRRSEKKKRQLQRRINELLGDG
ncbi:MAG TPA: PilZ domain-containing protein [Bradyrhizobium sp.]|uniref:PilZ domain-containing protein n=1 Tax=Bradyrhizobium sp. TaxID=376 RepID=UPI002B6033AC|nr:PilZ domain-containing protein [Bradyrhizobium sp.]HLZ06801.1 PilZ domain-containing protein [Bradyrhizobium sp.]